MAVLKYSTLVAPYHITTLVYAGVGACHMTCTGVLEGQDGTSDYLGGEGKWLSHITYGGV